jgi:hypothetical protein
MVEVSENGWTTDELGLIWLKRLFGPNTDRTVEKYRLLILDVATAPYIEVSIRGSLIEERRATKKRRAIYIQETDHVSCQGYQ